jgi:hypothetical protein
LESEDAGDSGPGDASDDAGNPRAASTDPRFERHISLGADAQRDQEEEDANSTDPVPSPRFETSGVIIVPCSLVLVISIFPTGNTTPPPRTNHQKKVPSAPAKKKQKRTDMLTPHLLR